MKRLAGLILCALLTRFAVGQDAVDPDSVTVRVFSVHSLETITMIPLRADSSIKACSQCKATTLTSPLTLKLLPDGIHVSTEMNAHKQFMFSGAFRVLAENAQ